MKKRIILLALALVAGCRDQSDALDDQPISFQILKIDKSPLIYKGYPGTQGNKYGFEGGRIVTISDTLHWITTEIVAEPFNVKTKLAHWRSKDGSHWERISTLYESSGDFTGHDNRAALWGPMPVYNERIERWNLFYISYRAKPDEPPMWYTNYEGRVWVATSEINGISGIDGPYAKDSLILIPGPASQAWEGLQGVDSFFPFEANNEKWLGFYGSVKTERAPPQSWQIGLAESGELMGPWERLGGVNPLDIKSDFIENPIVSKLDGELFFMLFDGGYDFTRNFGFSYSKDGLNWSDASFVDTDGFSGKWWSAMRTPLGLVENGDGTYTIYFTAYTDENFESMGKLTLSIRYNPLRL